MHVAARVAEGLPGGEGRGQQEGHAFAGPFGRGARDPGLRRRTAHRVVRPWAPAHVYAAGRLEVLAPVDEKPTWSVVCFFVARGFRRKGVSVRLLEAASAYAAARGATLLEGYPEEHDAAQPDAFVYRGLASAFRKAGFREAVRRSPKRPIMRKVLKRKGKRQ